MYESYLCQRKGVNNESGPRTINKLVQSIKILNGKNSIDKMQAKINKLTKLDPSIVEPMLDAFYSNDTLFVVSPFIEQGNKDLYRLA